MFGKHKIEMRVVKDDGSSSSEDMPVETTVLIDPDTVIKVLDEAARVITVSTISIIGAVFVARTAEHIIVNLFRRD